MMDRSRFHVRAGASLALGFLLFHCSSSSSGTSRDTEPVTPSVTVNAPQGTTMPQVGSTMPEVKADTTAGRWRTARDPATGRFTLVTPDGKKAVLQGVSMTGHETGTRQTNSGGGFWLFTSDKQPESANSPTVVKNVVRTLVKKWKADIVRIPICGSAWTQNYNVKTGATPRSRATATGWTSP